MKKIAIIVALIFLATPCFAANVCVLASASGANNGTSWTDAYTSAPAMSAITRGDTVYFGGGSYGSWTLDKATFGSTLITVKKATVADHGCSTGWSDSFASTAAIFSHVIQVTSHWVIDGQTGGGPSTWNTAHATTGFGFEFTNLADSGSCPPNTTVNYLYQLGTTGAVDDITVKHVRMHGQTSACDEYSCYPLSMTAANSGQALSNILFDSDAFDTGFGAMNHVTVVATWTVRNSYFGPNRSNSTTDPYGKCDNYHGAGVSISSTNSNVTYANNLWNDVQGTAVIDSIATGTTTGFYFYGNLEVNSTTPVFWDGTQGAFNDGFYYYNNTITLEIPAHVGGIGFVTMLGGAPTGTTVCENNVVTNSIANQFAAYCTTDYNYASGLWREEGTGCIAWDISCSKNGDIAPGPSGGTHYQDAANAVPFVSSNVDPLAGNFQLVTDTTAGHTLSSPYNVDAFGVTRGANGTWDMGAYQIPGSSPSTGTSSGRARNR